jgi:thiamine phosphate synthase YjbQ (UPF0047 family)
MRVVLKAAGNRASIGHWSFLIGDDERGLHADYEEWLEELPPHQPISRYRHNRTGEACPEQSRRDNGDAHLKRIATLELRIVGGKVVVAVANSRPDLARGSSVSARQSAF